MNSRLMFMKIRCNVQIKFPDAESCDAAVKAASHEGNIGGRAKSKLTKKDKDLVIEIEADDVVALRATANAYLRALQVFESVEEVQK